MANRIKKDLISTISQEQGPFVVERAINDSIMSGTEAFHWMNKRRRGKWQLISTKLDISKIYDRVELRFLKNMLRMMNSQSNYESYNGMPRVSIFLNHYQWQTFGGF